MPETPRTKQKDYAALLSQISLGNRPAFDELYTVQDDLAITHPSIKSVAPAKKAVEATD